MPNKFPLCSLL